MKPAISLCAAILVTVQFTVACSVEKAITASVEEVATNERLWTGIAVSRSGRMFVSFPRWSPDVPVSVAELDQYGEARAYPNPEMNSWRTGDDPEGKFVCVQSVYVDANDQLWILDPADSLSGGIVPGGARLFEVDLTSDEIVRTIYFDETIAPEGSYLNDVRVDTGTNTAFITDSGLGAIVVVDLETDASRRVLTSHPSTKAEDIDVVVDGIPFEFTVHSDGIALDTEGGWLYYQALTGHTLYRVPTSALRDSSLDEDTLASHIERFAVSGTSDGLLYTAQGVYLTAFEDGAIKRVDESGNVTVVVIDPRISWPDGFAREPDGTVVFTTSQLHIETEPPEPYRILRIVTR